MALNDFAGMSRQELNKFSRHDALMMWNDMGYRTGVVMLPWISACVRARL